MYSFCFDMINVIDISISSTKKNSIANSALDWTWNPSTDVTNRNSPGNTDSSSSTAPQHSHTSVYRRLSFFCLSITISTTK